MSSELPSHSKPKVGKVRAHIAEMAHRLGAHAKLPTIAEMCAQFDASRGTLHTALDELEKDNVIYRLHAVGIFVSPQVKKTICILSDPRNALFDASPFWSLIVEAHQRQARFFGFEAVVEEVNVGDENQPLSPSLQNALRDGHIHGLLTISLSGDLSDFLQQRFPTLPCVSVAGPGAWRVGFDSGNAIEVATEQLVFAGARRIAVWAYGRTLPNMSDWLQVAMIAAQVSPVLLLNERAFYPQLMRLPLPPSQSDDETAQMQGYHLAYDVFAPTSSTRSRGEHSQNQTWLHDATTDVDSSEMKPDGILILNDMMARGALQALDEMGIEAGRDVQIAVQTNAGSPVLKNDEPRIYRVEYDLDLIARTALEILENLTRGRGSIHLALVQPRLFVPTAKSSAEPVSSFLQSDV